MSFEKRNFYIRDDDGKEAKFTIDASNKKVLYNMEDVSAVLEALSFSIVEFLRQKREVTIEGVGTFKLKKMNEKVIPKNFMCPEGRVIGERYSPIFKWSQGLKTMIMSMPVLDDDESDEEDGENDA